MTCKQRQIAGHPGRTARAGVLVAELTTLPSGYPALLEELKARIRAAQLRAALTLNQETILLYWSIGQDLSSRFAADS
jgi:hypothetical protein